MSQHPLNLAVRFLLEIAALVALGVWGWAIGVGLWRYVLAVGVPVGAAVGWAVFRAEEPPGSHAGPQHAVVAVPGWVRLGLEAALFGGAVWGLVAVGALWVALVLGSVVLVHYAVSYDRIAALLRQ